MSQSENTCCEPLPEHVIEAITGEQLAMDAAALTGRTVEEVRQEGVQTTLVALYMSGGVPESRLDLQRLAQGESFVPPATETANPPTGVAAPCFERHGEYHVDWAASCAQCFA